MCLGGGGELLSTEHEVESDFKNTEHPEIKEMMENILMDFSA